MNEQAVRLVSKFNSSHFQFSRYVSFNLRNPEDITKSEFKSIAIH